MFYSAAAVKERATISFGGVEVERRPGHFTRSNHFGQKAEVTADDFGCNNRSGFAELHRQRRDALLAALGLNLNNPRLVFLQLGSAD